MGEVGEDFFRASLLLAARRTADENLVTRWRYTRPFHLVRPGNRNGADAFEVSPHLVFADSIKNAFLNHRIFQKRRIKRMHAGLHRKADLHMRVRSCSRIAEPARATIRGNGEVSKPLISEPQVELTL